MPGSYCEDCGAPSVGTYQFHYPNPGSDSGPRWSEPRAVCLKHKHVREEAGHRSRTPIEEDGTNAPDPAIGTQAPDYDKNPSGHHDAAPIADA